MRYATSLIGWVTLLQAFYYMQSGMLLNFISAFRGPSTLATFVAVYALFGPTFPGIYDKDRGVYTLLYPVCNFNCLIFIFLYFISLFTHLTRWNLFYVSTNHGCVRDFPLLFQFLTSIQIAAMMEKV